MISDNGSGDFHVLRSVVRKGITDYFCGNFSSFGRNFSQYTYTALLPPPPNIAEVPVSVCCFHLALGYFCSMRSIQVV